MAQTVIGFFDDADHAQRAVQQLVDNGFDRSHIDISSGNRRSNVSTSGDSSSPHEHESGITRFFKNLFGDNNDEAERYSRVGMRSNSIVTVHAQSSEEAERAADLLDDYGAINVNERASEYDTTNSSSDRSTAADYARTDNTDYNRNTAYSDTTSDRRSDVSNITDKDTTINRIEENLEVGKQTVDTGGVRVRSRIVEKPVEENIRLREERVTVDRNPVDREATRDELSNFEERDIVLTERAEVPVVNKEARVVEEIRVSKDVDEREETVRDTVRKTEVDVENLKGNESGDTRNTTNLDTDYDDDDIRNRNTRID